MRCGASPTVPRHPAGASTEGPPGLPERAEAAVRARFAGSGCVRGKGHERDPSEDRKAKEPPASALERRTSSSAGLTVASGLDRRTIPRTRSGKGACHPVNLVRREVEEGSSQGDTVPSATNHFR